jgi:hypothetical protein
LSVAFAGNDQSLGGQTRPILAGAGDNKPPNHAATQRTHLVVDGKVDVGPKTGLLGLIGSRGKIGFNEDGPSGALPNRTMALSTAGPGRE